MTEIYTPSPSVDRQTPVKNYLPATSCGVKYHLILLNEFYPKNKLDSGYGGDMISSNYSRASIMTSFTQHS